MSTAAYQTSAKPRSRRGSYGETAENSRSRASSSASLRLSKTLSRTLDEAAVPRNTRPGSPAIHNHRQRTHDSKHSDQLGTSARHSTTSLNSSKSHRSRYEEERTRTPGSAAKLKPKVVQSMEEEHTEPSHLVTGEVTVTQNAPAAAFEPKPTELGTIVSAPTESTRETPSPGLRASSQPTVAEEADDIVTNPESFVPPQMTILSSPAATAAAPSGIPTEDSRVEDVDTKSPQQNHTLANNASVSPPASGNPLPAPHPKASVTFLQPSLAHKLPEPGDGEISIPIMSSPGLEADATNNDMLPTMLSPVTSPIQSPMLQYVGSPPPQQVLYPYPYHLPFMGSPPFPPSAYPPPFMSPISQMHPEEGIPRSGSAGTEDERTKLLEKVSSVLPDIDRLLHYYRETQGLLTEKDHLVKQVENEHEEVVTRLRIELSASKGEYERIIGDQARENVKLKGELLECNEKILVLEDASRELSSVREQLANLRQEHECLEKDVEMSRQLKEQLTTEKKALEETVESLKKQAAEEQALHDHNVAELEAAHAKQLAEKEQEHGKALAEQKGGLSKMQLDLAGMITKHTQQKKELDSARATISEHELSLTNQANELANATKLHQDELHARDQAAQEEAEQHELEAARWAEELSELKVKHEEEVRVQRESHEKEVELIQNAAEARLAEVKAEHSKREAQLQEEGNAARSGTEVATTELAKERETVEGLKIELANSQKAHEALARQHEMTRKHHAELAESMRNLNDKQAEWHRESERVERLLQGFGQLMSNRNSGKGDQFFVSAFDHLALLVEEISQQFFQDDPSSVLHDPRVYQKFGFPDISGPSEAARALRGLVVQHQIWNIIQRRIFAPFLFISSYGADSDDELEKGLCMLSKIIGRKSVRREAVWRHTTMQAIYASAVGRKAAQVIATRLSSEVIDTIWALPPKEPPEALRQAVRSVAKAAVQIWRRARLECDLIHSSMPSTPGTWKNIDSPSGDMLSVRPHIVREVAAYGTSGGGLQAEAASCPQGPPDIASYVYLQGVVLSQDSPVVQARRQELVEEEECCSCTTEDMSDGCIGCSGCSECEG
ncbi:hypothetical protein A1O1_05123 [Capronia coronata CBS 617.96]|uniref:Uncharacterized protein n=1 Tax=Capronia coronata CBS 617.96 TaxID=1182541 RepID=W9Y6M9_9EURO|nr:uncharacterized protein A1O1_05123 [Capronia coronata CBS 617.96]EXJ88193.1 hypothetical protein A1O1_05123 [Capronia coronata CBS 617.96]